MKNSDLRKDPFEALKGFALKNEEIIKVRGGEGDPQDILLPPPPPPPPPPDGGQ